MRTILERGRGAILLAFLAAAAGGAAFLPRFGVDATTNSLLNEDDPDLGYYNLTRAEWSYDDYAIVCVRRDDWFDAEGLAALKELSEELGRVPHAKRVLSILSVPLLRNRPGAFGLPIPVLLSNAKVDVAKAKAELLGTPDLAGHTQALGNLISEDGKDLNLLVYLDMPESVVRLDPEWSRAQGRKDRARLAELEAPYAAAVAETRLRREALVAGVRAVAARWGPPRLAQPPLLSGLPLITVNLVEHVTDDLRIFGVASLAIFVAAFALVYRRVRWTVGPIAACLLPVLLVLGAMSAADKKVTVVTSNLPVLLFTLMLPYTVYLVERYRERRGRHAGETNLDAVAGAARDVWTPCLYSCTTTMAGFASLLTSGINPVRTFGLMMAIGMAVGLAAAFLFLPSLVARLRPLEETSAPSGAAEPRGIVRALALLVLRAPWAVIGAGAVLLAGSVWGATRLKVETKFIDYFWPGSEIYRGLAYIDTHMGGTTPLEVMLTSKEPGHFRTKAGLDAVAAAAAYFDGVPEKGNVRSFPTLISEVAKAMPKAKEDQVVKTVSTLAKDLVREFCNEDFTVCRVLVRFKETAPTLHRNNLLRGLEKHLAEKVRPLGVEARATGVFQLYANMLNSLIESQRDTLLMVLAAIFAMLLILFRSLGTAVLVLVPQALPVAVCLGVMGWAGIALDLVTVMVASIAMGVGIDAAIQYAVRYRLELDATGGDSRAAVLRSHATIGRAIWIATSIVVFGFGVLGLSRFVPTVTFGLLTALAMLMGQFAALTLLPALFRVGRKGGTP